MWKKAKEEKREKKLKVKKVAEEVDLVDEEADLADEKAVLIDNKTDLADEEDELDSEPSKKKNKKNGDEKEKGWLAFLIVGIIGFLGCAGCVAYIFLKPPVEVAELVFPKIPSRETKEKIYSSLTGLEIADSTLDTLPTYCVQIPNGTDGARPQVGLTEAAVIFEAIAEAGITRFATIFQNPQSAVIGPIRSLRLYYLEWDTPFGCTIVHAGGADDAIAAVRNGGYRDLTENYTYMYRGNNSARRWNNLFTTATNLTQFNSDRGYTSSTVTGFSHLTPDEAMKNRIDDLSISPLNITSPAAGNTSELAAKVGAMDLYFGSSPTFNVHYDYDLETNTYRRSFKNGNAHEVYNCPREDLGEKNPEAVCALTQLSPSVVIAMVVSERKAADNYHEAITTTGSGTAYIFQNGTAIKGTWNKPTRAEQIRFIDEAGQEIKLVPGQAIVSAIPAYGGVEY